MALLCEHCKKSFPTNASLYKHKYREHNKSSLVLVSHNHKDMNNNIVSNPKKRVYPPDDPNAVRLTPKRYRDNSRPRSDKKISPSKDPQYDDELVVIDQYKDPGENQEILIHVNIQNMIHSQMMGSKSLTSIRMLGRRLMIMIHQSLQKLIRKMMMV